DPSQHPWMYRAIVRRHDGELLGHVSFHHKAPDPDLSRHGVTGAELAYTIESTHRRRGYAKEAAIGMMEWASREFDVRDFVLTISPDNLPSLRMAESMGFRIIGEQDDPVDGLEFVMKADIDRVLESNRA
nr:GNAT family N-acetyltransferase [Deltaproteobacteria bacterium]